jgi:hypothetical protein
MRLNTTDVSRGGANGVTSRSMWVQKPLVAGSVYAQISAARRCGRVICGACSATTLEAAALHFGLSDEPETYHEVAASAAEGVVFELLQRDLAFRKEIIPPERAEALAREFIAVIPADSVFYTNGSLGPGCDLQEWMPATEGDFDCGVIAVSAGGAWCFWVED